MYKIWRDTLKSDKGSEKLEQFNKYMLRILNLPNFEVPHRLFQKHIIFELDCKSRQFRQSRESAWQQESPWSVGNYVQKRTTSKTW